MLPLVSPAPPAAPAPLAPASVLAGWMATARAGDLQPRLLRLADGRIVPLPVSRWTGALDAADTALLDRARGAVLDVGCGPGRLTAALHARDADVLGVELLPGVPVLARRAGAPVHEGDVFGPVPRAGSWSTALLADGNVGIGGDPARLLRRMRSLLAPDGQVLVELHPDPETAGCGPVRLEGLGATSAWFRWALVDLPALSLAAATAGLSVTKTWQSHDRPFAILTAG